MSKCETSRLGAIPCLVSCLSQRILQGNVRMFDVNEKDGGRKQSGWIPSVKFHECTPYDLEFMAQAWPHPNDYTIWNLVAGR